VPLSVNPLIEYKIGVLAVLIIAVVLYFQ